MMPMARSLRLVRGGRALHRGGDRAGEGHVLGDVLATIDAGEHKIRRSALNQVFDTKQHAIGRRSRHRKALLARFAHADRRRQCQRTRRAGFFLFRRNHPDIVAERARDFFEDREACRVDAVVIGAENAHGGRQ